VNYNWNWGILLSPEPGGTGTYLYYLIVGLGWTLATALAAWVIALAIGSVVGTLRTTPYKWIVRLGNGYVEVFRNIPLIVQMFLWFFVVPELLPKGLGDWIKQVPPPWGSYLPAVLCLGIFTSVRVAEQVRAGINSLPRGQVWSGYALGLNYWQTMGHIVLPQAFRNMIPVLLTQTIILFQDTSLVYVISVTDFFGAAAKVANRDYRLVEMYTFVAVVYFAISFSLSYLVKILQSRTAIVR
jgi:glutamate/aspartate transport system permease protein